MIHIYRLAAQHALALEDREASSRSIETALDWIDQHPDHLMAFHRIERFMDACENIDPQELARLKSAQPRKAVLFGFRRSIVALAASIALVVMAGAGYLFMDNPGAYHEARYETPPGTIRSIRLAEGSDITLSGASAISVTFRRNERRVALLAGEALFSVAPDKDRPFIVQTQNGSVRAIGTAFDIHRGAEDTTVSVLHGRVEVLARGAGYISRATLDRMMQVRYSTAGEMSAIKRVDPETITSWRRGEFHFADTPLVSVIDDLNRYSAKPIIIENPSLEMVKISGIVEEKGILEWLGALPAVMDVEIIETPRDIRIRRRARPTTTRI